MFRERVKTPGVATSPKQEMVTASGNYTEERLYLIPIRVPFHCVFSQYDWDFRVVTIGDYTLSYKCAIYERVGGLTSGTPMAVLVTGTSVTVTGYSAATLLTTALGTTKNLLPGDYFIGFIFDHAGTAGGLMLSSPNSMTLDTTVTGSWVYTDPGSFTLPTSINGANVGYIQAASEQPFWAALTYIGDVIP